MHIFKPNLAGVITSVRSTNSPNLLQMGCEMALPRGGEYNGFVTFFSRLISFFFRFLGQPTGRNFGPLCTLYGSKDHVPIDTRAVSGFGAFKFRKTVTISLLFDQSSLILVEYCYLDLEHINNVEKAKYPQFKMAAATILDFEKLLPYLYYLTDLHQT